MNYNIIALLINQLVLTIPFYSKQQWWDLFNYITFDPRSSGSLVGSRLFHFNRSIASVLASFYLIPLLQARLRLPNIGVGEGMQLWRFWGKKAGVSLPPKTLGVHAPALTPMIFLVKHLARLISIFSLVFFLCRHLVFSPRLCVLAVLMSFTPCSTNLNLVFATISCNLF